MRLLESYDDSPIPSDPEVKFKNGITVGAIEVHDWGLRLPISALGIFETARLCI